LEEENSYCYIDLGPSGTLATFVKYILKDASNSKTIGAINPFGQDISSLEKLGLMLKNHF
jgi:bacillaene synthase trans-acting acyltransferase/trans-AT polyketide synthase/acyltransferase/oxidoreductase domain-containing protein